MLQNSNKILLAFWFTIFSSFSASNVMAVGGGFPFQVNEGLVPNPNTFALNFMADSMDFTYHSCETITTAADGTVNLSETGYFWISSYQNPNSVVDSQINHFRANGYHIYGIYKWDGPQVGIGPGPLGRHSAYEIQNGEIDLYLDPDKNTVLGLALCNVIVAGNANDQHIGSSNTILAGEKREKVGLANGDYDVQFVNWVWDIPDPIVPGMGGFNIFEINANITTDLTGILTQDHFLEGSGNLFWVD